MQKEYTIISTHRGRDTEYTGTLDELTDVFGYRLECGHAYNPRIPRYPKTARALEKALNDSVQETQGSCYEQDCYTLVG